MNEISFTKQIQFDSFTAHITTLQHLFKHAYIKKKNIKKIFNIMYDDSTNISHACFLKFLQLIRSSRDICILLYMLLWF